MIRNKSWLVVSGVVSLLTVLLVVLFAPEVGAAKGKVPAGIPLEYLVRRWDQDLQAPQHQALLNLELNALGKDGWELVSGHVGAGTVMIFKRPK